jgi:hypothetical protein
MNKVVKLPPHAVISSVVLPAASLTETGNFLARTRREIRQILAIMDRQQDEARQLRDDLQAMRAAESPFDRARLAYRDERLAVLTSLNQHHHKALVAHGARMNDVAPYIDQVTTAEQRCDLLNVNAADRHGLYREDGFIDLVFVHGLEDSAEHRRRDFKDGPFNRVIVELTVDFMCKTRKGRAAIDDMFKPGGLLESIPRYQQREDGSMVRMAPQLHLIQ